MKILQLCKKFPFPLKDGESIAVYQLARSLYKEGAEITLLAMNTSKHYYDLKKIPGELSFYKEIRTVFVDNDIKVFDALRNLLTNKSYHIQRFISGDFSKALRQLLTGNTYDIVQLETIYLAPYIEEIRKYSKAKIVLRSHNLEYEIWERIAANTGNILRRKYLKLQSARLRMFELSRLREYDYILAISCRDEMNMRRLEGVKNISTVSVGIEVREENEDSVRPVATKFGFVGSLDWMPNLEGISWFIKNVVPEIAKSFDEITFSIAGRNTPAFLFKFGDKQVKILGEVDDASDFIRAQDVMVVPLFSGSGMRIKILEAMSLSKVVITTSIGSEGINARDGQEVLIAENETQFAEKIRFAIENPGEIKRIGANARDFIAKEFNNEVIAAKLIGIYEKLLINSGDKVIVQQ